MKYEAAYKDLLSAPVNLTWEITKKCNLHCSHCLSAETIKHCDDELSFEQCCSFIDELYRMSVFQINFGGGEPFLREDFIDILNYTHKKGITTCVSTNGTTLNDSLAKKLTAMDLLYIQVSLDGAAAETNDRIRGKGSFDRIIKGIEHLVNHSFPNLSINTVVTAINFREILDLYELGRRYEAKTRLSRFRPSGNAKKVWEEYHLSKEQLAELSEFLSSHRDVLTGDSFFSITAQDRRDLALNMCGAARMTCSVSPDGKIYPCAFLQDDFFISGRAGRDSFESVWNNAPVFNMIRNIRVEACETCPRFNICHGGCPAVAYFLTKSLNQSDPECMLSFQEYLSQNESAGIAS
ncbi:MAG: mycofactocin radical SAM maturase [Spirochaetes bacterium]|nr:mycofactocin radical SAM maturase [Spirochaetota bacterium]